MNANPNPSNAAHENSAPVSTRHPHPIHQDNLPSLADETLDGINLNGIYLAANGVNYMVLDRLRKEIGLEWEHNRPADHTDSVTFLVVPSAYMPSKQLFTPKTRVVIEWGNQTDILSVVKHCARHKLLSPHALRSALILSVSTQSATQMRLAEFFFQNLASRANLPKELSQTIEFCLAELIANAILHGHLSTGETYNGQRNEHDLDVGLTPSRQNLLNNPAIAAKHIIMSAIWGSNTANAMEIAVTDQGGGFDPDILQRDRRQIFAANSPSGRGLALIQRMGVDITIEQAPNEVRLNFA